MIVFFVSVCRPTHLPPERKLDKHTREVRHPCAITTLARKCSMVLYFQCFLHRFCETDLRPSTTLSIFDLCLSRLRRCCMFSSVLGCCLYTTFSCTTSRVSEYHDHPNGYNNQLLIRSILTGSPTCAIVVFTSWIFTSSLWNIPAAKADSTSVL